MPNVGIRSLCGTKRRAMRCIAKDTDCHAASLLAMTSWLSLWESWHGFGRD